MYIIMAKVLIIDDEPDCLKTIQLILESENHEVAMILDGGDLDNIMKEFDPDIVITDILMPGITGSMVYEKVRREYSPYIPVIISSGTNMHLPRINDPLLSYENKPITPFGLLQTVKFLLNKSDQMKNKTQGLG